MTASRLVSAMDLLACAAVSLAAGFAYLVLPGGSALRLLLALPLLFFAPGYLVAEAAIGPAHTRNGRITRAFIALGTSPAVVGVCALSTALLPGGFRAGTIVLAVTLACLGLAGIALWRRALAGMAKPLPVAAY